MSTTPSFCAVAEGARSSSMAPTTPAEGATVTISIYEPTGVGVMTASRQVRLKRRRVTVSLTKVVIHDDLDALTAGDFDLTLLLLGHTREPDKDHLHAEVSSPMSSSSTPKPHRTH